MIFTELIEVHVVSGTGIVKRNKNTTFALSTPTRRLHTEGDMNYDLLSQNPGTSISIVGE